MCVKKLELGLIAFWVLDFVQENPEGEACPRGIAYVGGSERNGMGEAEAQSSCPAQQKS